MFAFKTPDLGFSKEYGRRSYGNCTTVDHGAFTDFDPHVYSFIDAEFEKVACRSGFLCIGKELFSVVL